MSELKTYTTEQMKRKLQEHERWQRGLKSGVQLDLSFADLREHAELLIGASLNRASLIGANLNDASLNRASLIGANLNDANLNRASLIGANLNGASLNGASLNGANLNGASLNDANLNRASLNDANLNRASLIGANLNDANLNGANLNDASLSNATGLLDPTKYINKHFEAEEEGIIVYKSFGSNFTPPSYWTIKPGSVIEEVCNPCRGTDCASGVNVATLKWAKANNRSREVWKCLIRWEWLAGVIVPFATDGKIRASKVELVEVVKDA